MKTFVSLLLIAACFVACAHSFPGLPTDTSDSEESDEKKSVDTVLVLSPESGPEFDGPVLDLSGTADLDDDSLESFLPSMYFNPFRTNPFSGFMSNMENVMKRIREQMAGILSRMPEQGVSSWGKIPEGANTTSTTKIIDGHVVTINETTYMDGDDEHGTLIRIRVIDVKPQNDTILQTESAADAEVTTLPSSVVREEETTTATRSIETVEDFDNEIPKNQVDTLTA